MADFSGGFSNFATFDTVDTGSLEADTTTVSDQLSAPASINNDESANRSFDTWYQNTSGVWLYVVVHAEPTADGTDIALVSQVNSSQTNNSQQKLTRKGVTIGTPTSVVSISAMVPDGAYYKITSFGDTADYQMGDWEEMTLGA